jgi:hypothetical protein
MLRSDNDMTSGQRTTIQVQKTPQGTFRASVVNTNLGKIAPVEDKSEMMAIRQLNDKLNAAYVKGEVE